MAYPLEEKVSKQTTSKEYKARLDASKSTLSQPFDRALSQFNIGIEGIGSGQNRSSIRPFCKTLLFGCQSIHCLSTWV